MCIILEINMYHTLFFLSIYHSPPSTLASVKNYASITSCFLHIEVWSFVYSEWVQCTQLRYLLYRDSSKFIVRQQIAIILLVIFFTTVCYAMVCDLKSMLWDCLQWYDICMQCSDKLTRKAQWCVMVFVCVKVHIREISPPL